MFGRDLTLRKYWLLATLLRYVVSLWIFPFVWMQFMHSPSFPEHQLLSFLLVFLVAWGIWTWLFCAAGYCAYHKFGTKYLTVLLIMVPVVLMQEISWKISLTILDDFSFKRDGLLFLCTAIGVGLDVWWYVLSLRLRCLNKRVRQEVQDVIRMSRLHSEYLKII